MTNLVGQRFGRLTVVARAYEAQPLPAGTPDPAPPPAGSGVSPSPRSERVPGAALAAAVAHVALASKAVA